MALWINFTHKIWTYLEWAPSFYYFHHLWVVHISTSNVIKMPWLLCNISDGLNSFTFTANLKWPDIQDCLYEGQTAYDQPDIIAHVFHLKIQEFLMDCKHGLPHMHMLLFIKGHHFITAEHINEVVCAKLPDPAWDPMGELTELVAKTMGHGPCSNDNLQAPGMIQNGLTMFKTVSYAILRKNGYL